MLLNPWDYVKYDKKQPTHYVNIVDDVAKEKTQMYMGRGIEFYHEDKEVMKKWAEFNELNDFYSFMFNQEVIKSKQGACFVTLSKNKEGLAVLNTVAPYFSHGIAVSFATPTIAVIVEQLYLGDTPCLCESVYDTEKIVRKFFSQDGEGPISVMGKEAKIPDKYLVDLGEYIEEKQAFVKYHNLGFCPVFPIYNQPFYPSLPTTTQGIYPLFSSLKTNKLTSNHNTYYEMRDTANCAGLIEELNKAYENLEQLSEVSKPKMVIANSTGMGVHGNPLANKKTALQNDKLFGKEAWGDIQFITCPNQDKVQIQTISVPNTIENYISQILFYTIQIKKMCGISYLTQSGTQKTTTESYSAFKESVQTINFMRNYDTDKWKNIIKKAFIVMGMGEKIKNEDKWSFQVKKNMITDESSMLDNLIKMYQVKLITQPQMLAAIEGMGIKDAEAKVEDIMKWFKEHEDAQMSPAIQPPMNANVSGIKSASLSNDIKNGGAPTKEGIDSGK